ncbi:MAG: 50S ribosomal protein L4 [Candidatus Kerfeldbacteria bacterium]|nr:50S ribosomal protein L4 [Candidatus Kerfeldbacteria bacterium]
MAQAPVYNLEGKKTGDIDLEKKIFDIAVNPIVVQQAIRTQQANRRIAIAHTKGRGDVRGGGKKPWAQKGTGRARHGSIRSPLWSGGGVTFGPTKERNFTLKMNRKARRKALCMTLSDKAQEKKIIILESLELSEIKTKTIAALLKKLPVGKHTLLALPSVQTTVIKSARNIPQITTIQANSLNTEAVLGHETLVMPKASLEVISKTLLA